MEREKIILYLLIGQVVVLLLLSYQIYHLKEISAVLF